MNTKKEITIKNMPLTKPDKISTRPYLKRNKRDLKMNKPQG